ncbi:MAG: class I SAM-dependent methyltransferase [Ideonella sp.]|jgi:ubiquinone/menaquinone biosynthesis C-methylase UbiE|nr:class I SAM-dependent methyltransferase [Ideonella sp.]MBL0148394.1 class I SAM-dependent methyltransferase [Ideonella sp.]
MRVDAAVARSTNAAQTGIPSYLERVYWWAYVHPKAVYVFERQWLVNLILWGNFGRLRDRAIELLSPGIGGKTLQIACVYGDLTGRLAAQVPETGQLDVVDILPVQLDNLQRKLPAGHRVGAIHGNSAHLDVADGAYDQALLFFLLHEQPEDVRRATLSEALRVVRPGGRLVIVDYHQPKKTHPLRWLMRQVLTHLEPFAMDLWHRPIEDWLPPGHRAKVLSHSLSFGGLYQVYDIQVG